MVLGVLKKVFGREPDYKHIQEVEGRTIGFTFVYYFGEHEVYDAIFRKNAHVRYGLEITSENTGRFAIRINFFGFQYDSCNNEYRFTYIRVYHVNKKTLLERLAKKLYAIKKFVDIIIPRVIQKLGEVRFEDWGVVKRLIKEFEEKLPKTVIRYVKNQLEAIYGHKGLVSAWDVLYSLSRARRRLVLGKTTREKLTQIELETVARYAPEIVRMAQAIAVR